MGTLQSSTLVTGYGLLASPTTTSISAIKPVKDKKGNVVALDANVFKTTIGATASTTTTAAPILQDMSYQQTLDDIRNQIAIVESLSDEELARMSEQLELKEAELSLMFEEQAESSLGENVEGKKPYTK